MTGEGKPRARFIDGSAHYAGVTQKWTATALLWDNPERDWGSESSHLQSGRTSSQCTWSYILLEKWSDVC